MKSVASFTHPSFIPNLYDFISYVEQIACYFKEHFIMTMTNSKNLKKEKHLKSSPYDLNWVNE